MAEHLFLKLVVTDPLHRYSTENSLKHPFITRIKLDDIPMTYLESCNQRSIKIKFKEVDIFYM